MTIYIFGESTIENEHWPEDLSVRRKELYRPDGYLGGFHLSDDHVEYDRPEGSVFYFDGTMANGYYAIKNMNDDEYIWVDCTEDQLSIFVDALNREKS